MTTGTDERFYVEPIPYGWAVADSDGDEGTHTYADEAKANYVAMLRNAGVEHEEAEWMAQRGPCVRCGASEFRGSFDDSGRCAACQN